MQDQGHLKSPSRWLLILTAVLAGLVILLSGVLFGITAGRDGIRQAQPPLAERVPTPVHKEAVTGSPGPTPTSIATAESTAPLATPSPTQEAKSTAPPTLATPSPTLVGAPGSAPASSIPSTQRIEEAKEYLVETNPGGGTDRYYVVAYEEDGANKPLYSIYYYPPRVGNEIQQELVFVLVEQEWALEAAEARLLALLGPYADVACHIGALVRVSGKDGAHPLSFCG